MFWGNNVGSKIAGSFKVDDGLKINAESYSNFLDRMFF